MANIPLGNFGNVMPQAQAGRVLDTGAGQVAQAVGQFAEVGMQVSAKKLNEQQKIQEEKEQYQFNIEASKYGAEYQDYITETKNKLVTGEYDEATAKAYLRQRTDELAQNYVGRIPEKQKERFNYYSEKMYNDSQAGIKPLAYETERRSINADFEQVGEAPLLSGYLHAHQSVLQVNGQESPQVKEMRLFDPSVTNNKDDYVDSLAGAISAEPIRIGSLNHYPKYDNNNNWQASNQYTEMKLDF